MLKRNLMKYILGFITPILLAMVVGLIFWQDTLYLKESRPINFYIDSFKEYLIEGEPSISSQFADDINDLLKDANGELKNLSMLLPIEANPFEFVSPITRYTCKHDIPFDVLVYKVKDRDFYKVHEFQVLFKCDNHQVPDLIDLFNGLSLIISFKKANYSKSTNHFYVAFDAYTYKKNYLESYYELKYSNVSEENIWLPPYIQKINKLRKEYDRLRLMIDETKNVDLLLMYRIKTEQVKKLRSIIQALRKNNDTLTLKMTKLEL